MQAYRYAPNIAPDGQKKKEQVFKKDDELPDGIRYALMAWPILPEPKKAIMTDAQQARWDALDDRSKQDIELMREFTKREKEKDLNEESDLYPLGSFFAPIEPIYY
jgi:hypothetical protein